MKKYRRLYVSWHWRVMQSLTENWLLVPKVTWGIRWILLQTVALKICTLLCYFCWKDIIFELKKKYREVIVITLKNDVQFEEELTFALKNDMKNYTSFENIKICALVGSFWPKYIMFELKKYRRVMCDYTEDRCKLWREVTCSFINDMRNLVNLKNHKTCTLRDFFCQRCIMLS